MRHFRPSHRTKRQGGGYSLRLARRNGFQPSADYPDPHQCKAQPCRHAEFEWRDANDITAHAPTPQEKVKVDNALFKAIREYEDAGMGLIDEALGSGIDINAHVDVNSTAHEAALRRSRTRTCRSSTVPRG